MRVERLVDSAAENGWRRLTPKQQDALLAWMADYTANATTDGIHNDYGAEIRVLTELIEDENKRAHYYPDHDMRWRIYAINDPD